MTPIDKILKNDTISLEAQVVSKLKNFFFEWLREFAMQSKSNELRNIDHK